MKGFFKVLGLLAVLGLLLPVGQVQAAQVKFTFATTNSPKDFSSQAVMRWQKAMKEASNGELDMTFIPGGALGGDKQLLQQLSANEIQLHVAGPVVVHHLVREYQCMEAEFVYKDEAHGFRVWTGPLGKEVSKKLESQYNVTIVGVGSRGARNLTSNVPVREPADMKGIKIRVTNPLRQEIFKAFGALPAPLSIKELYGALRQGVFEAQENPISTIWGHKFYEVQKYINLTGHVWSYWVISANKGFVDSLSAEHSKIFMNTLNDAVAWLNKTVPAETNNLLKKMEQKGVTVIKPDVAAFQKVAAPIVKKFASEKCRPGLLDDIAKYK
ncbi:MAG: DctP family TRAP transporter solute-binding subunit [Proteobacteria bacterium]|nr:DctP family TRAP transporter solute-binding subunit [Pseudomonadota bacterium]